MNSCQACWNLFLEYTQERESYEQRLHEETNGRLEKLEKRRKYEDEFENMQYPSDEDEM